MSLACWRLVFPVLAARRSQCHSPSMECQREHFTIPRDTHYLNCAYMSPLSERVVAAGIEAMRRKCVPSSIAPRDFFSDVDRVRHLVPAVSYGMAVVAKNTPISGGQNIVAVQHQFPSNVYTWKRLCAERGAELRVVAPLVGNVNRGASWNQHILEAIDRKTALVAMPHVHWTDGTIFDLLAVGARARDVGAMFVIDGTQSVGAFPFDAAVIKPDALVCASYKWLMGPYATGVAYFGDRFLDGVPLEETWIGRAGSEDFNGLVDYQGEYRPGAVRFDVGENSNFALIPMLAASLEQVLDWGVVNTTAYTRALTQDLFPFVKSRGYGVETDQLRAPHLFGIRVPPTSDTQQLKNKLESQGVFVSLRGDAVRISPHVYNDANDIARLMESL